MTPPKPGRVDRPRRSLGGSVGASVSAAIGSRIGRLFVWTLAIGWSIPTFGLLVTSFRPERDIKSTGWWTVFSHPRFTLANYHGVFGEESGVDLGQPFLNSFKIVIPAVFLSVTLAALASYALSWMSFPGRDWLFVGIVALLVVPLQMAVIPLLRLFNRGAHLGSMRVFPALPLNNTVVPVWIAHAVFGLPFCVFILRNFIAALPAELIEAGRIDGAGDLTIFWRLVLPLSVPSIASLTIFQFIFIWNDFFVGKIFGGEDNKPVTAALVSLSGDRGQAWHLLTPAAFVATVVPLVVFFGLQRYFVKGLLAGSVKG